MIVDDFTHLLKLLKELQAPRPDESGHYPWIFSTRPRQHEFSLTEADGTRRCLNCRLREYDLWPDGQCDTSMP